MLRPQDFRGVKPTDCSHKCGERQSRFPAILLRGMGGSLTHSSGIFLETREAPSTNCELSLNSEQIWDSLISS
jgi:hypothetical protein